MDTERVWSDFSKPVHRYIRARVSQDADADDILQDVFVKVLRHREDLRDEERLAGWIFRVASNAVTDHHRGRRRDVEPPRLATTPPETDLAAVEELAHCVRPFIEMLEEPYRSALIATDIEGLTQRAAAEQAGISVSGMKSRVQRGRAKLRELFERCCEFELDARNRVLGYEARCSSNDCPIGPDGEC